MKRIIYLIFIVLFFSCEKEPIPLSAHTDDIFFVKSGVNTLPIRVKGNSGSKVFVIYIHGGPGDPGIWEHNTTQSKRYIQPHYAAVYFDQPYAGFAQGNNIAQATVETFTDAVNNVVQTIKYRYGDDISIFILGHSWGGFVSSAYLSSNDFQQDVKGWINISGAHNYMLGDSLVGDKIKEVGQRQIDLDLNKSDWQAMIEWINTNPPDGTSKRSNNINSCGFDGMTLMSDSVNEGFKMNVGKIIMGQYEPWALTAFITNLITTNTLNLNQLALDNEMSSQLPKIKTPVLNIYGKYDFIVPVGLGEDVMKHIGSSWKKLVIMNKSDHNPQLSEAEITHDEIQTFIETFK